MTDTALHLDTTAAALRMPGNPVAPGTPPRLPAVAATVTRWVHGTGERVTTTSPLTGQPLADLVTSTAADVADAYATARRAQRDWAARPVAERARVLLRFHDLVLRRQHEALDLIQLEAGKARRHALEEVLDTAVNARYYARTAARTLRPRRRAGALPGLTRTRELRFPQGVVGVISPWNYPLALATSEVAPALVAGNAVVHRPDTATALTALWARQLAHEAGLPAGVWQVVLGDGPVIGTEVVRHADHVCFTGSTRVGRIVAAQAGERLVAASLELGGKNPLIVLDDVDVDRAVEGAIRASFASAGQLCMSTERLYVHRDVHDAFVERFVARTATLRLGVTGDFGADLGSLASARQLATVTGHVRDAVAGGATVLTGGRARPDIGPFVYEPTVLTGVRPGMLVHDEETFGPVVAVHRVESEDEAVRLANDTHYGLNASVWSGDGRRGERVAARIDAGSVNVNDGFAAVWGSVDAPMGGWGDSGLGGRHGAAGLLRFTEPKTVARQRLVPLAPAYHAPAARTAAWGVRMTRALQLVRRIGA